MTWISSPPPSSCASNGNPREEFSTQSNAKCCIAIDMTDRRLPPPGPNAGVVALHEFVQAASGLFVGGWGRRGNVSVAVPEAAILLAKKGPWGFRLFGIRIGCEGAGPCDIAVTGSVQ